jgi:hypothetical protein
MKDLVFHADCSHIAKGDDDIDIAAAFCDSGWVLQSK